MVAHATTTALDPGRTLDVTLLAQAPIQLAGDTDPAGSYQPGVCNIGPAEIARRRRSGHVGLVATVVLLLVLVVVGAPPLVRLLLILPAGVAASGYLQAAFKFCAGFASQGIFNFGPLGQTETIADASARRSDQARARQILAASLAVGIAIGVAAVLLPL